MSKPTILLSSCGGPDRPGDGLYNGGVKNYNMWAKLLRQHDYEVYIVTWDGTYTPWLCEYQPYIDLDTAKELAQRGNTILVTTWLDSPAILDLFPKFYYDDHEVFWTDRYSDLLDQYLAEDRIECVAVTNQRAWMWYAMRYGMDVDLIQVWYDRDYWRPKQSARVPLRIGFMIENTYKAESDMAAQAHQVQQRCKRFGFEVTMLYINGHEPDVIAQMQSCDIYIGLGMGKHPLWGEGGPAMHIEAMLAGAVVVAYNSGGNHEYLVDGYTGFVIPCGDVGALANRVVDVLKHPIIRERVRQTGTRFAARNFTSQVRWPLVARFLGLQEESEDDFTRSFRFD